MLFYMAMKRTALFLKEQQLGKLQKLSEKTGAPVAELVRRAIASRPLADLAEELTPREIKVLQMLANGWANKEIAARLSISEHTVKFHVASIVGKLGAASRTEAVALGIRRGIVLL
jgi:two-component system, NarL family, response regulator YdfI